ncbi:MAG TPA: VOC family protein [Quisquiliibacterium sp.]|nr:VOC family protein [Quisquiliibacterium sp.]HQD82620.1 VOC family protein [Quisquiliibacterium sp.]HQN10830.1 VOC family protein [Quisquiliibacterium sp.]HQP66488.1 VOC family protein [Quisquiliibacterium sp.]
MLRHVAGLDHLVIAVHDLERAARAWRRLGFTLSPPGTHSAHMGTGNFTIMFGDDYLELLGVLAPTPQNAPMRAFLERGEGVDRAAFTALDAAAGVSELQALGIAATGPLDFGRPVDLPGGGRAEARFRTMYWPTGERPGGMRLFACQHLTRDAVWIPELQRHANGARGIARVELLARDPRATAQHLGRLIDQAPVAEPDGAWRVASGGTRGDFVVLDRARLRARYPGVATDALSDDGAAAIVLRVDDVQRAAATLGDVPFTRVGSSLVVPSTHASGLLLVLTPA